jgi:4-amino-4-deoxy-L-arabinose transferase-like glycosyltransferase
MDLLLAKSKIKMWLSYPIVWVMIGGFLVRLYSAGMRTIINPDGAQYIFQASAILNQHWSDLFSCRLNFVSPLPFFIAAAFGLFKDWIIAGQAVNVLFGTATLVPLYYLLKRFADRTVCTLTLLIYALMPVLVEGSGNILRDPMFWFFSTMGMLMFIRQFDDRAANARFRLDLLLSCLCFSLATWARIEGVLFLVVSPVYLLISSNPKKIERLLFFIAPFALCGLLAAVTAYVSGNDFMTTTRLQKVFNEATQFAANFETLNSQIKEAYAQERSLYGRFLSRAREILILIPLVTIFHNILEGIFYPFAVIFLVGFMGLRQRYRQDHRIGYFLWLTLAGFFLLYVHIIQTWIFAYRFLALLIFPGCIIMASGVEITMNKLMQMRQWPSAKAACVVALFLIFFGLPKSLKPEERDKIVYRQAAQIIAQHRPLGQIEKVYTTHPRRTFEWVLLYSHRNEPALRCSKSRIIDIAYDYKAFRQELVNVNARYFLYEKRNWPSDRFDLTTSHYQNDLRIVGQWEHPDSDTMILFERIAPQN